MKSFSYFLDFKSLSKTCLPTSWRCLSAAWVYNNPIHDNATTCWSDAKLEFWYIRLYYGHEKLWV